MMSTYAQLQVHEPTDRVIRESLGLLLPRDEHKIQFSLAQASQAWESPQGNMAWRMVTRLLESCANPRVFFEVKGSRVQMWIRDFESLPLPDEQKKYWPFVTPWSGNSWRVDCYRLTVQNFGAESDDSRNPSCATDPHYWVFSNGFVIDRVCYGIAVRMVPA